MSEIKDSRFISAGSVDGADIKLLNNQTIFGRDVANAADVQMLKMRTDDKVAVGPNGSAVFIGGGIVDFDGLESANFRSQSGDTLSRPSTPNAGQIYFDTDLGIPIWYNGTNWVDATGATV